jgi:hypothetical protein
MATDWYYFKGNPCFGPVGSSQLKELATKGNIPPADLIWKEGSMAKAVSAVMAAVSK